MRDDDLVVAGELGDRPYRGHDIRALRGGVGSLTSPEQGIATECDNDAHGLVAGTAGGEHRARVLSSLGFWPRDCHPGAGLDRVCAG